MKAVIVCNGSIKHPEILAQTIKKSDLIIAADGGARNCLKLGIEPDVIIGDMDSCPRAIQKRFSDRVMPIDDQDFTDSEKAILYARERGIYDIVLLCATGDRLDHSIANLFLVEKYDIRMVDHLNDIVLASKKTEIKCKKGDVISLIPLSDVEGLKLEGLRYTADRLNRSFTGIHNISVDRTVRISFKSGTLLIDKLRTNML